jgi:hypothetical protein
MSDADDGALFPVAAVDTAPPGRAELAVRRTLEAGYEAAIIGDTDAGMAEGALIAARALDCAERLPDKSRVYAVAQLMRPYQDALHALRLPAELSPASVPSQPAENGQAGTPEWLRDAFGTPG